jgi:protoporphyrinogen oxidase
MCLEGLVNAGLIDDGHRYFPESSFVVDLDKVYPVYHPGWEQALQLLLDSLAREYAHVYSSGRPGFFLHNNLDHSIVIGLELADCLENDLPPAAWYERLFQFHEMRLRD